MPDQRDVRGKQFGILGAGRSGRAAARLLRRHGADVLLSDASSDPHLTAALAPLAADGIAIETGGHSPDRLRTRDTVIISPGMDPRIPLVRDLEAAGVPVLSELEVASWFAGAPIIAVTGTNGKTTVTTLIGALLSAVGRRIVTAGNIGNAFSEVVDQQPAPEFFVVEVSSYQLERIRSFHPHVAVLLNITPDHLSRYGSFADYANVKMRITNQQTRNDVFLYNADDSHIPIETLSGDPTCVPMRLRESTGAGVYCDGDVVYWRRDGAAESLASLHGAALRGPHNALNMAAALAAARWVGAQGPALQECLENFATLPHRMEIVATRGGVTWINDSKATNVDAVAAALQTIQAPILLIAGGEDKGGDLTPLNDLLRTTVQRLLLMGPAADRMEKTWRNLGIPIDRAEDLASAVSLAGRQATAGATVLLSPACASFDAFTDYAERGACFRALVAQLPDAPGR